MSDDHDKKTAATDPAALVEKDGAPTVFIMTGLFGLGIFLVAVFVGVGHFVKAKTFAEYEKKTLAVVDDRLPAARERDREETTAYGVLDAAAGRYRIPVDEAVRAMIGHPESLAPIVFNQPAAEEASEPEAADGAAPGAGG